MCGFDAVATQVFGAVEGDVGEVEQVDGGLAWGGNRGGDSYADGLVAMGIAGVGDVHFEDRPTDVFGDDEGILKLGGGQDDGELFSTEAGGAVGVAMKRVGDDVGD